MFLFLKHLLFSVCFLMLYFVFHIQLHLYMFYEDSPYLPILPETFLFVIYIFVHFEKRL